MGEFIRRAVSDRIAVVTAPPDNDPGPFRPASGHKARGMTQETQRYG